MISRILVSFLSAALVACGDGMVEGLLDPVTTQPTAPPIAPHTECSVTTGRIEAASRTHVDRCSPLEETFHPNAAGPHYGMWADFASYTAPVPWGFLLHSLEHGAVILAHNCESGCPEVISLFETLRSERDDPLCRDHPNGNRIMVVPDPDLDTPIAAVAWGHVYIATCLDEESLRAFIDAHYAQAPEDLCVPGLVAPTCP